METNETILTREAVALDDRKKLGKVKALRVATDDRKVSHYVISSASTGSELVLPFEKALAVGDTFLTIQGATSVLSTESKEAIEVLREGYTLLNAEVYSRTGNKLGKVTGYEFDPVFGTVTSITLDGSVAGVEGFSSSDFMFFTSEFVFVDDGAPTADDLRSGTAEAPAADEAPAEAAPAAEEAAVEPEAEPAAEMEELVFDDAPRIGYKASGTDSFAQVTVTEAPAEPVVEEAPAAEAPAEAPEPEAAPEAAEEDEEDDGFSSFLIGAVLNDDVVSKDGEFRVAKGTTLTKELVAEAKLHDEALLLLTMCIDV
jgi:sporulation protein YlmC with PRC-barrel domain